MHHYYPGQQIYSIGTIGCNFKCQFCQNWQLSMDRPKQDLEDYCNQFNELTPTQVINTCKKRNLRLIAFTYNEPTIWIEYNLEIAKLAKQNNMECVYVSNGFMSKEVREVLKDYITGTNIDLKCFNDETYKKVMGGRLQEVCDNIKFFYDAGVVTEVTTLVIPQMNDSDEELRAAARFLASVGRDIPWHLSAFHPDYQMTDRHGTPVETLMRAQKIGKEEGLQNVYVGNVNTQFTTTYCECGAELVLRRGYNVQIAGLKGGACARCGKKPYGRYM